MEEVDDSRVETLMSVMKMTQMSLQLWKRRNKPSMAMKHFQAHQKKSQERIKITKEEFRQQNDKNSK